MMAVFWYYLPEGVTTRLDAKCGKLKAECDQTAAQELCRQLGHSELPDGTLLVRWSDDDYSSPRSYGSKEGKKDALKGANDQSLMWKDPTGQAYVMAPSHKYAM